MGLFDVAKKQFADQTPDEIKLAGFVKSRVEEIRASTSRISHESIWLTNRAYVIGYSGVYFNSQTKQFQPLNRASPFLPRNRVYVNKVLPTLQNRLARLLKSPPKYEVRPESMDMEDKEAARLGLQVINFMWEKLNINMKRIELGMGVQQDGHGYIKICWDDTLGKEMVDPETGEMSYEGDLRAEYCSAFECFPNSLAKNWDEVLQSDFTQAKVRPLDYFRKHYPEKGHLVKEESPWLMSLQYEERSKNMNTRGSSGSAAEQTKNTAIELIRYEARSKDYPKGRMIVVANGILLADKELPCGEIPFAKFDDIVIAGKYYSEAIVTHLRPLQDQFNETVRRRSEWTRKFLAGKYIVPRGAGLAQESLNDQSGEVVWYSPVPNAADGGRPTALQVPSMPQWAYNETESYDKYFNDLSGISDVSQGNIPSASIPALGMQILVEQDMTRIGVMTDQHELSWARVGSLILKYVEQYYTMPRTIKLAGKNMEYTVKSFKGSDLRGNTDVIVTKGSTQPNSKALQRQDIMNAYQNGLLGDPANPKVQEKVLDLIEFGDVQGLWEDYGLTMAQIKRGIEKLEQGINIDVSELDNHTLWVQELNRYRIQPKFDTLNPYIQGLFLACIEAHVQAQMELTNAVPDAPPGTPGGPPTDGQMDNLLEEDQMNKPPLIGATGEQPL